MQTGEIYHLAEVPPLHAGPLKGRYVVVVTEAEETILDEPIFVVACTATATGDEPDRIALPWSRIGAARTGFRQQTWAVPKWMLKVRTSNLGRRVGHIPSDKLHAILDRLPDDPSVDMTEPQSPEA